MPVISITSFKKLQKMMSMTFSPAEGERLNAITMANKILTDHSLTWDDVFNRLVSVDVEPAEEEVTGHSTTEEKSKWVDDAFEFLHEKGIRSNFISSVKEQWERKHWLSKAQRDALFDNVQRAKQPGYKRR